MNLIIDKGVFAVDLTPFNQYIEWAWNESFFPDVAGNNHHHLLAYLVEQLPDGQSVADLGTRTGASALALSSNPYVNVLTYDIENMFQDVKRTTILDKPNIKFTYGNCFNHIQEYMNCALVLLDIAPHDGIQEQKMLDELIKQNFKGVLILDDIKYNDEMRNFWNSIKLKRLDVTPYGHHSGTGIVVFDPEHIDVEME